MFAFDPVVLDSPLGPLALGVVDTAVPGVAEGIARLLYRSIQDARAEAGGHLPGWLVDDIERNYISPERVRTLWAATGHRFVLRLGAEIVGTIHVAKSPRTILTVDRHIVNVDEAEHPGFKPAGFHHVVNISVKHELRRARLAQRMVDGIATSFRHLFSGEGLWVRADPPWHAGLAGLGFAHDPRHDVFLPPSAERTAGLAHADFNARYACGCGAPRPELATHKLQYVSMTRPFTKAPALRREPAPAPPLVRETLIDAGGHRATADVARPRSIDEVAGVIAWARRAGRRVVVRGRGQSYAAESLGGDVVLATEALAGILARSDESVTVLAGTTWRALLGALDAAAPPVVPSHVESSVGGVLASRSGGLGKGSLGAGRIVDHVRELVVVTGDARTVTCSRTQAAWLFEAVLGATGYGGVIVAATLELVPGPLFVARRVAEVDAAGVAAALTAPGVLHASARARAGRFAVQTTHAAEAGTPFREHLLPREPGPIAPRSVWRHECPAPALASVLDERVRALDAGDELWVHPVRAADGSVVFSVQHLAAPAAAAPPRPAAPATARLADPDGVLG